MTAGPQIGWLPDGRRLHMNHGPIDLIVEAWGEPGEVARAYGQAADRFDTILAELVAELPDLRRPAGSMPRPFKGPTAWRMERAVSLFSARFITPMAAVAGAVADEMLAALVAGRELRKAYVNDGGDIALHLSPGESMRLAVAGTGHGFEDRLTIEHASPVRGVATSGWRGRSFSLGIADAVTVLGRDGATADAAATLIANAVDIPGHPAIARAAASSLQPDSDLCQRLVTTGVGSLTQREVDDALERGLIEASEFFARGLIESAGLFLAGMSKIAGSALPLESPSGRAME